MGFSIQTPSQVLFGRGSAAKAGSMIGSFGTRVLVVHGANRDRASWLAIPGAEVQGMPSTGEPTPTMLEEALFHTRRFHPEVVGNPPISSGVRS